MANENNDLFSVNFDQISDDSINLGEVTADTDATQSQGEEVTINNDVTLGQGDQAPADAAPSVTDLKPETATPADDSINIPTGGATGDNIDTDNTKNDSPDTVGNSSPVTPFASFLQEKGFLRNLDMEKFKQAEDPMQALAEAWGNEVQIMQQQIINSFPKELIDMANAVQQGIPLEALRDAKIQEINYSKITEDQLSSDKAMQKRLVSDYLQTKGFKADKITDLVNTYEDSGRLEAEAKESLGELQVLLKQYQEDTKKQYAMQQQQFEAQHKQRIDHIQKTITDAEEIIPGMRLTDKAKQDLFANMTQIVGQDANGQPVPYIMALRQEDPLKFDMAVTYLAQTTKGFTDWSKLTKKAKSSATSELEKALKSTPTRTGGASKSIQAPAAEGDLMASINKMFG